MKEFFEDLFAYHRHFNQELIGILLENHKVLSTRTVPLYSHVINAHQIWNSRILRTESFEVNEVHSLEKCAQYDQSNYLNSLKILNERSLDDLISYSNSKGNNYQNTVRDMLFQVINHTTHHRGQIISDLRLNGIAPPITDYIWYKR